MFFNAVVIMYFEQVVKSTIILFLQTFVNN